MVCGVCIAAPLAMGGAYINIFKNKYFWIGNLILLIAFFIYFNYKDCVTCKNISLTILTIYFLFFFNNIIALLFTTIILRFFVVKLYNIVMRLDNTNRNEIVDLDSLAP